MVLRYFFLFLAHFMHRDFHVLLEGFEVRWHRYLEYLVIINHKTRTRWKICLTELGKKLKLAL
jgi:hypothetical protein